MTRSSKRLLLLLWLLAMLLATTPTAAEPMNPAPPGILLASSSNDWRCFYGPGLQVWQDINKGGPSMIFCGDHGRWDNLSNQVAGLDWISHDAIQVGWGTDPSTGWVGNLVDAHATDHYHAIWHLRPYNANRASITYITVARVSSSISSSN